jgi:hypothetical protein
MPTPIPPDLIHRPDEVERDAELFDHLCELVEEIAFPIVQDALTRETAATGAEILTEETQRALEIFVKDVLILEQLDEEEVIQKVRKTLSDGIIPADEGECRQHTREFSQVLVSGWLDILWAAESRAKIVILSDYLMPLASAGENESFNEHLETHPKLPPMLMDAVAWFGVDEDNAAGVMKTLHDKLFSERRVLELPLNLTIAGGPTKVMALSRKLWDRLIELSDQYLHEYDPSKDDIELGRPFTSPKARTAVAALSEPLPVRRFNCLRKVAMSNFEEGNIEAQLRQALR